MSRNLAIVVAHLRQIGFDLPDSVYCKRTFAGRHQRDSGAWSWGLWAPSGVHCPQIGSQWPLAEVAAAARRGTLACDHDAHTGDWHLTPEDDDAP